MIDQEADTAGSFFLLDPSIFCDSSIVMCLDFVTLDISLAFQIIYMGNNAFAILDNDALV